MLDTDTIAEIIQSHLDTKCMRLIPMVTRANFINALADHFTAEHCSTGNERCPSCFDRDAFAAKCRGEATP